MKRRSMFRLAAIAGWLVLSIMVWPCVSHAQRPQFSDYPSDVQLDAAPVLPADDAIPDKVAALGPIWGIIREDAEKGPNFAGAYHLATAGCGTGCEIVIVIDLRDGTTRVAPEPASNGVVFQKDSRLIIYGEDESYELPRRDFVFDNGTFRAVD